MPEQDDLITTTEENGEETQPVCQESLEELTLLVEELERDKALLTQQLLRLKADFENFRRRSRNQMEDLKLEANEELLAALLPILDNFERALGFVDQRADAPDSFYEGVQMVQESLLAILVDFGLEAIAAEGEPFDPCLHDAIMMQGNDAGDLVVLKQIQTGYLLNGKILRHTRVLVGQNEEEE